MSTQDHKSPQRRNDEPDGPDDDATPAPAGATTKEGLDEDTDGVLDEIDSVLESNAEEFVRGFVQKGGQ